VTNVPAVVLTDRRYYTMDMMRGIAALAVAMDHFGRVGPHLISRGYIAVDFFFMLSGFVLYEAYGNRVGSNISVSQFISRRLIRLYPLYLVGFVLGIIKVAGAIYYQDPQILASYLLWPSLIPNLFLLPAPVPAGELFPFNGPTWTLFFELAVNLLFAIWLTRQSTRRLATIALLGAVGIAALTVVYGTLNIGWSWTTFPGGLARTLFAFTTGMVIARIGHAHARRVSWHAEICCAVFAVAILLPTPPAAAILLDILGAIVMCPLLIVAGARFELSAVSRKIARLAGDLSFPIYCIHFPIIFMTHFAAKRLGVDDDESLWIYVVVLVISAQLLFVFFDQPLRRWLASLFQPTMIRAI
jgi:peptidoglycan/LPS O-acetylase OafA/YrhL